MYAVSMRKRWIILVGGILVQLVIGGGLYSWSVFARALTSPEGMGLTATQAAIPFEAAIGTLFFGTFVGGILKNKFGSRPVAVVGVFVYALGVILSSLVTSADQLWLLVLSYGVISGFGLGMAYIVPLSLLQMWFPDKAAFVTGAAVAGFGLGPVITAPVAQMILDADPTNPTRPFLILGVAYLILGLLGAFTFVEPTTAAAGSHPSTDDDNGSFTLAEALRTPQWYLLMLTLTLSVTAGISIISVFASTAIDITGITATAAAAAVGVLSIFNGAGRLVWAAISAKIGRRLTLALIMAIQGAALVALPHATVPWIFLVLSAFIYLCYGGTFGVLPSTVGHVFGVKNSGSIYGLLLIGWSLGGVAGPLLTAALIGDSTNYTLAFTVVGVVALASILLPVLAKPDRRLSIQRVAQR